MSKEKSNKYKKLLQQKLTEIDYDGTVPLDKDKQELFCLEYLKDNNQTAAAKRAGYSETSARTQGYKLMNKPYIIKRIEVLKKQRRKRKQVSADRVLAELAEIAFADIFDYIKITKNNNVVFREMEIMKSNGGAIQEISTSKGKTKTKKIKLHDKLKALDMIMKHLEMYEQSKLAIQQQKLELQKKQANIIEEQVEDDGFIDAMKKVATVMKGGLENLEDNIDLEGVDNET